MFQGQKPDVPGLKTTHGNTLNRRVISKNSLEKFKIIQICKYLYNYRYIIYGKQIKTNHNYPPIVSGASSGKIRKNLHENSHLIEILQGGKTPRGVFPIKSRAIAFFGCKKSSVRRGIPQKLPYRDFPPPQMGNLMTPCIFFHQTCCIVWIPPSIPSKPSNHEPLGKSFHHSITFFPWRLIF